MKLILDFTPQDSARIIAGTRCHTIRHRPAGKLQPNAGDDLVLIADHGSPKTHRIRTVPCEYVQDIVILPPLGSIHQVMVGSERLQPVHAEHLAHCEGFASLDAFVAHYRQFGLPWRGIIVGWAPAPSYMTRH